jgi:hypothetical protein
MHLAPRAFAEGGYYARRGHVRIFHHPGSPNVQEAAADLCYR